MKARFYSVFNCGKAQLGEKGYYGTRDSPLGINSQMRKAKRALIEKAPKGKEEANIGLLKGTVKVLQKMEETRRLRLVSCISAQDTKATANSQDLLPDV